MAVLEEVIAANETYVSDFEKGELPMPPGRSFAVLTCMDARIDPARALGLEEGDAHVIRNAGGIASDDALRSLVISHHLLGTQEAFVIGHTDCGMLTFQNEDIRETAPRAPGRRRDARRLPALPELPGAGPRERPAHPRVRATARELQVHAFVYDVATGRIEDAES